MRQFEINLLKPAEVPRIGREISRIPLGKDMFILLLSFSLLFAGGAFFYLAIYFPGEREIKSQREEIGKIKKDVQAVSEQREMVRKRLEQLVRLKEESINWGEKLGCLSRLTSGDLWLTIMELKSSPVETKEKTSIPKDILLIRGAVPFQGGERPLKVIAEFMGSLMREPAIKRDFQLQDWTISSPEKERENMDFELQLLKIKR